MNMIYFKYNLCNNNINYYKNLYIIYYRKINYKINNIYEYIIDYFNNSQCLINICFKKYTLQTNRFINYNINNKIGKLQKKNDNMDLIDILNFVNINNLDFLNIDNIKIDLDKIKFRKMSLNHNLLGLTLNIEDVCYKDYELFNSSNKRFYYL
jgi:hypothetical protein